MERDQTTTLVALHGFLGSSADFSLLKAQGPLSKGLSLFTFDTIPQNYDYCFWDELVVQIGQKVKKIIKEAKGEVIVLGYSMGGRLLLDLLQQDFIAQASKVVFVSSHLGLFFNSEIQDKNKFNQKAYEVISHEGLDGFLEFWNQLALFNEESPLVKVDWTAEDIQHYFNHWAHPEERHLPLQLGYGQKAYYIYGEKDLKYKEQAKAFKSEVAHARVLEMQNRGHRLLRPEDLQQIMNFVLD